MRARLESSLKRSCSGIAHLLRSRKRFPLAAFADPLAEPVETTVVAMPYTVQSRARLLRYLTHVQSVKENQFQDFSLRCVQPPKRLPDQSLRFIGGQPRRNPSVARRRQRREFRAVAQRVCVAEAEISATVDAAPVRGPHDPHLSTTLGGIESRRGCAQAQENFLGDVFGFRRIAHYTEGDTLDQSRVAIEKDGYGVAVTSREMCHYTVVRKLAELRVGQPTRLSRVFAQRHHRRSCPSKEKAEIYSDSAASRCLFGIYISLGGWHEWVELRVTHEP